jgi:hypothetical protein
MPSLFPVRYGNQHGIAKNRLVTRLDLTYKSIVIGVCTMDHVFLTFLLTVLSALVTGVLAVLYSIHASKTVDRDYDDACAWEQFSDRVDAHRAVSQEIDRLSVVIRNRRARVDKIACNILHLQDRYLDGVFADAHWAAIHGRL